MKAIDPKNSKGRIYGSPTFLSLSLSIDRNDSRCLKRRKKERQREKKRKEKIRGEINNSRPINFTH